MKNWCATDVNGKRPYVFSLSARAHGWRAHAWWQHSQHAPDLCRAACPAVASSPARAAARRPRRRASRAVRIIRRGRTGARATSRVSRAAAAAARGRWRRAAAILTT